MAATIQVCPASLSTSLAVSGNDCFGVRFLRSIERPNSLYLCASSMSDMLPEISFSASGLRSLKQGLPRETVDLRPAGLSQAVSTLKQYKERRTERSF